MTKTTKMATLIATAIAGIGAVNNCEDLHKVNKYVSGGMLSVYALNQGSVVQGKENMMELARDVSLLIWNEEILGAQTGFFYERILNDYLVVGDLASALLVIQSLHKEIALHIVKEMMVEDENVLATLKAA